MESRWEGILASIFNGFWWILGAKLGPSWEGKSSQDRPRQAKTGQDKASEGKGRERKRKGRDWKGKVWKSVPVDLCRAGGEGFTRPLGGHCLAMLPLKGMFVVETCILKGFGVEVGTRNRSKTIKFYLLNVLRSGKT